MPEGSDFVFVQCINPACSFRFPIQLSTTGSKPVCCPVCKGLTYESVSPLPQVFEVDKKNENKPLHLEVILDNIRSAFNVGAMFRSADGCGVAQLYLCGTTPTPEHPKVKKTALGAEFSVPWSYHMNSLNLIDKLIEAGKEIWGVEDSIYSQSIDHLQPTTNNQIVLVVGNELAGIDPAILNRCSRLVGIPMSGYKRSLNVEVAFSIAVYFVKSHLKLVKL